MSDILLSIEAHVTLCTTQVDKTEAKEERGRSNIKYTPCSSGVLGARFDAACVNGMDEAKIARFVRVFAL